MKRFSQHYISIFEEIKKVNTKQVVLFKNNYYVKIKNNFYGPFHSCADADIRGTPKESLKLEKPLTGRIRYLKTVFY